MPKFIFNKLVRDKLVNEYAQSGQKATYRTLNRSAHLAALKRKIIEEANEIPVDGSKNDVVSEIADVQQVIDDLKVLSGILDQEVADAQRAKLDKKGGFSLGHFVEALELKDDDEWLTYYRSHPNIFTEVNVQPLSGVDNEVLLGEYEHYKGKRYEVIGVGKHTESGEDVVIYQPLYGSDVTYWVRPLIMFCEEIDVEGSSVPRFRKLNHDEQ